MNTSTPLAIDFDGRDKIAATRNVAVTRTGWASSSNTLLAGSVEVFDTNIWGTDYLAPVGENIPDDTDYQMFSTPACRSWLERAARRSSVDANADGDFETNDVNNVDCEGQAAS